MKMGVDAKEFQAFMWRVVIFSINTCATLAQKYPSASCVLLSFLILYLFLPSVFFFLIYSLPFLGCTAVFIHYYLNPQRPRIHHGDERKEDGISSIEARRLLQKDVNKSNDESDANAVKEEKNMVSSMISNDELIGRTALAEEKPKTIMEEKESCALNSEESSSDNVPIGENISELGQAPNPDDVSGDGSNEQPRKLQVGGEVEVESSSSEADDDEEEEESERGGENAVQWTDYDQKNVMELGNSEIERNRRLEILIARRKARKSFKMNSIAGSGPRHPVLVARSNTFHVSKRSDEQIPGSAPSILLPTQNPFDLPYDPHEEKPNLMADSFHEEFMADYLKEFPFCRHESFSSGNSFQDNRQGQHEGRGYSRSKMQSGSGNHDRLVDHLLFHGGETLRRNLSVTDLMTEEPQSSNQVASKQERDREVGTTRIKLIDEKVEQSHCKDPSLGNGSDVQMDKGGNAINHNKILSNPSSFAEDVFNAKKAGNPESIQPTTFKFPEVFYDRAPNSLPCPVPKARVVAEPSYDSSPSAIDSSRMEEHFIYKLNPGHTPNHSIASDMHVEVSEIGSPPLIEDGTASSNDDESLIYDGDSEKELTSGSEELWGASPLAPKDQEHAKALIQIYEEGEEFMTELGFSRVRNEPEDPISRAEISQEDQAQSMKIDPKLSNHVKDQVEEVREQRPSNASDVVPPENSLEGTRLMEGSMAHTPSEMYFPKPQESPSASGNSAEEKKTNCDANDTVSDDREYLKSNENRHVGDENSIMQEVSGNLSEPSGGNNSTSNGNIKIESLFDPENCVAAIGDGTYNVNDSRFLINDHIEDSKSNEERNSEAERVMQAVIGDLSQPVESNSESSNYIESKSLNSPEKSREEEIFSNGNDPSVQIKDSVEDFKDVDQDSERLTEDSDIQSILMPVEAEDSPTSTQGSKEDQSTIEVGVSVVNQPFIDPTTSATLPEFVFEQVSNNSSLSSSPKSVLAYRIPADIGSTSDFSQLVDTGMEENLPITATQDTSLVVNDSTDHPSIDTKSEEPYDTQGMCTEEAIDMGNMNGSELDDEQIKENLKSRKNIEYESETLISNEASVELSKPLEEPQIAGHLEGASARLVDNEASINVSKPDEEHFNSKFPGVIVEKEEESTNIPRDVAGEVNHISDVSDPSINKNEDLEKLKSFEGSEGEPQISTGHEIFAEPLKPDIITSLEGHEYSPGVLTENETIVATSQAIEEVYNSRTSKETDEFGTQIADQEIEDLFKPGEAVGSSETTKDVQGDPKDLIDQKAVLNPSTPAVDDDNILVTLEAKDSAADIIHNVKESEMCEAISDEKFKQVQDSEDESQMLDRQEDIMEPRKAVEVTNSESTRDIEGESKKLADDEVNVTIPSQPEGEINSSNDTEKTEDSGKSIVQENGMGISETSRGDDIARAVEDNKGKSEDKNEING